MTWKVSYTGWPSDDVHAPGGLCDMIAETVDITRGAFLRHVDRQSREEVERELGYAPDCSNACLTMAKDYHVSYHRSTLHGRKVWFFKHSAIEYVFTAEVS